MLMTVDPDSITKVDVIYWAFHTSLCSLISALSSQVCFPFVQPLHPTCVNVSSLFQFLRLNLLQLSVLLIKFFWGYGGQCHRIPEKEILNQIIPLSFS